MHSPEIDRVAEQLSAVVDDARSRRLRLGFFAAMYRQMTVAVKQGIESGSFDDGARMSRLAGAFAGRYLDALSTWNGGSLPSRSWRVAFRTAGRDDRLVLQHVILGINAHINLDLGIAAAEVAPGDAIADLRHDFQRINDTISRLLDAVQTAVARFSPLLGVLDRLGARTDEEVLSFSFGVARDEAWKQAVLLAHQGTAQREQAIFLLDRKVAFLGKIVADPGGIAGRAVDVVRFTESDDVVAIIDALGAVVPPTPAREVSWVPSLTGLSPPG